jgi:hypothetical protein
MKYLKGLQRTHSLSILILAHTPKIAESTPITQNDMAGSKHLMNFVDSAFALGQSHKNGRLRYLKQIFQQGRNHNKSAPCHQSTPTKTRPTTPAIIN